MGNQQSVIQHLQQQINPSTISAIRTSQLKQRGVKAPTIGQPCIFNAQKYSEANPDLQNAFHGNTNELKQHYINYGINEGRSPCGNINISCKFDAQVYRSLNQDLKNLTDPKSSYVKSGINEGRAVCPGVSTASDHAPTPANEPSIFNEQKRIELNMAKSDVKKKQTEFDTLVPCEAKKRKTDAAAKEANDYIDLAQTKFNSELDLFNSEHSELDLLVNSPSFLLAKKFKDELKYKLDKAKSENLKFRESSVTNRRRFLDANPHESVNGLGPFATIDDRTFLLFWISYALFIISMSSFVITYLGTRIGGLFIQNIVWIATIIFCFIIAHLGIKKFG